MVNVFAVPVFFICFRECLETTIVVSILFNFLKRQIGPDRDLKTYKKLRKQVRCLPLRLVTERPFDDIDALKIWLGTAIGLTICVVVGCGFIGAFYGFGKDHWADAEEIWEGSFALVASLIISVMGAALLRISKLQDKWRVKLAQALEAKDNKSSKASSRFKAFCEKYAMLMLPLITVLREGLEAVVFIGGVSLGLPATSIPIPAITGLAAGCLIGYFIY
ncbi:MAG: hypothetical protein Q9227_003886, partial [Pyrenula ochraceoflavens]